MTLDRQPVAAAERWLRARATQMIRPMRIRAPRTIHNQMSEEPDPLAAAGEPVDWAAGAGTVALWITDGGAVVGTLTLGGTLALGGTLGLALGTMLAAAPDGTLMLRLGVSVAIGLPLPHPATEHAAKPIATARSRPPAKRRMPDPSAMKSNLSQDVA
jgi:hypothetical protein